MFLGQLLAVFCMFGSHCLVIGIVIVEHKIIFIVSPCIRILDAQAGTLISVLCYLFYTFTFPLPFQFGNRLAEVDMYSTFVNQHIIHLEISIFTV
jgi:hypothetical protein